MPKAIFILTCITAAAFAAGCGPRRDVATRVKAGDAITSMSIVGFTNGVPISVMISDPLSLRFITEGLRLATDSGTVGNVYEAHVTIASGYSERVMLMVKIGGDEITLGTGEGLFKEPIWHTIR
jgi:hypothetical protein